jgi:hypothetical protein
VKRGERAWRIRRSGALQVGVGRKRVVERLQQQLGVIEVERRRRRAARTAAAPLTHRRAVLFAERAVPKRHALVLGTICAPTATTTTRFVSE